MISTERASILAIAPFALIFSGPTPLFASSTQDAARADAHCAAAKTAAGRAAEQDRRARDFERQAQTLGQESSRLGLEIGRLQNDERLKQERLAGLKDRLRESARQTGSAVQTARARFQASRSQATEAGSRRALSYVENVLSSLSQFSGSLARCAEMPQACSAPQLNCPSPPDVSLSPGAGASSRFVQQVNESNRQFVAEHYQTCAQAGRGAARSVQELRAAMTDLETVRRHLAQEEQRKQRTDLELRQAKNQAAQALADAKRFSEEAKRESLAADQLMSLPDYCRTPLVDYSTRLKALREAADAAGRKTHELMNGPGKDPR